MTAKSRERGTSNGPTDNWQFVQLILNEANNGGFSTRFTPYINWRRQRWNNIPGWKALLESQGYLPTQGYTDEQRIVKPRFAVEKMKLRLKSNPRNGADVYGPYVPVPNFDFRFIVPPFKTDMLADAKNSALNKAKRMRINLAVTVAEGRSTIRMLTDTVRTLGEAYSHFRKGRWKKAARRLEMDAPSRSSANNWLAYQLGWLPLVSDAVGLIELHRDQYSTERDNRFIVRGGKTCVEKSLISSPNYLLSGNHGLLHRIDLHTGRAGMLLEVTSKLDQFQASVGLSPADILSTVWELIPYSFVFDYFVNVGQWLGNLTALSGIKVLDSWQITEVSRTTNFIASGDPASLYTSTVPDCLTYDRSFVRSYWNPGSLTWPRTRSITDQSTVRLITMAALFRNQFTGDPPIGKFRPSLTE